MKSCLILKVGIVMKLTYIEPIIEVIEISHDEIIVTSNEDDCNNQDNQ